MSNKIPTIGLFGTYDGSDWRNNFIKRYEYLNIPYYNPAKDDWQPSDAVTESQHLASDDIIIIPVLNTAYGFASLSEIGFAAIRAINENKSLIVIIDDKVDIEPKNDVLEKASNNTRAIIKSHVSALMKSYPQIYLVYSLDDALDLSIKIALNQSTNIIQSDSSDFHIESAKFTRRSEQKLEKNLRTDPRHDERTSVQKCKSCFYNHFFGGAMMTAAQCHNCHKDMTFGSTDNDYYCLDCAQKLNACVHCGKEIN